MLAAKSPFKTILILTVLIIPFVAVLMNIPSTHALNINSVRDCKANSVVPCGALSTEELQQKCDADASIRTIFNFFGVTSCDLNTLGTVEAGQVTSSGDVFACGHLVAINAITGGRDFIAGSQTVRRNGLTFFVRPPSVSFVSSPLAAFVVMNNGCSVNSRFRVAVLASCGNAVKATPIAPVPKLVPQKPVVKTPTPQVIVQAAPIQQQQQQQQQQTVVVQSTTSPPSATPQQQQQAPEEQQQQQQTPQVQQVATTTPAPKSIPATGAGNVLALGAVISLLSGIAHFLFKRHRVYKSSLD